RASRRCHRRGWLLAHLVRAHARDRACAPDVRKRGARRDPPSDEGIRHVLRSLPARQAHARPGDRAAAGSRVPVVRRAGRTVRAPGGVLSTGRGSRRRGRLGEDRGAGTRAARRVRLDHEPGRSGARSPSRERACARAGDARDPAAHRPSLHRLPVGRRRLSGAGRIGQRRGRDAHHRVATRTLLGGPVFRISDFSRLTRVTVKALRHYDRLGLLTPVRVDDQTGYRYYSARQAADVARILALKDLGFSLEHVGDLLSRKIDRTSLARLLESKRAEIESRLETDRARLRQVEASLRDLEAGAGSLAADVVLRESPPVRVASRRAKVAELDDGVEELFETLEADVAKAGVRGSGPPILLYHDRDHRERDARVEVAVPVLSDAKSAGRSPIRTLPGVPRAACVLYRGSYEQWGGVMRGLLAWLQARRLTPSGPVREVFLQFGTRGPEKHEIPRAYLVDDA